MISEKKMQIVIDNYFKSECDVNTSIRQAFEKGFRIGVKKGLSAEPEIIRCKDCKYYYNVLYIGTQFEYGKCCRTFTEVVNPDDYCSRGEQE